MRKLFFLTIAIFLLLGTTVRADDAPAAASTPKIPVIGVVDMQTIAMECEAAKAFKEQMESRYGKERSSLENEGQSLKKQAESLKNPKTSNEKKNDFLRARQNLDNKTRNFMRKIEQEEMKFRQELVTLIFSATYEVAKEKGYTFVVDITGGGVLYADPSMDITKDVMAGVNKKYQEGASKNADASKDSSKQDKEKK